MKICLPPVQGAAAPISPRRAQLLLLLDDLNKVIHQDINQFVDLCEIRRIKIVDVPICNSLRPLIEFCFHERAMFSLLHRNHDVCQLKIMDGARYRKAKWTDRDFIV